jgi:hypothetical protein
MNLCIYINGEKEIVIHLKTLQQTLPFLKLLRIMVLTATTTTHYLSENQNNYPFAIGNYGLVTPGNGTIKYFRIYDSNIECIQRYLDFHENYK